MDDLIVELMLYTFILEHTHTHTHTHTRAQSWHRANQSWLYPLNTERLARKKTVPMLTPLVWRGRGPHPRLRGERSIHSATQPVLNHCNFPISFYRQLMFSAQIHKHLSIQTTNHYTLKWFYMTFKILRGLVRFLLKTGVNTTTTTCTTTTCTWFYLYQWFVKLCLSLIILI